MNMRNNIYIRSNKSIKTISLTKMFFLIPLIVFGLYKNGIYLYKENYISFIEIFRPLVYILIGSLAGIFVNIFYEKVIKKSDNDIISVIFSSFHVEYGVILGCLVSINTNIILYTLTILLMFLLSKFLNNRINVMCVILIIIYIVSECILGGWSLLNVNEASKSFSYEFMDYLVGRYPGGIASTHIILILLSTFGLFMTNNIKSTISLSSLVTIIGLFAIYSLIANANFSNLIFSNNIVMIMCFVATDSQTSSYTKRGMIAFGVFIGILTVILTPLNAYLAPLISVLIISLFNNLIDRKFNSLLYK